MARVSPFLQMLLTKKRPDFAPVSPLPEEDPPPPVEAGPTIPLRPQPAPIAQQPTVPLNQDTVRRLGAQMGVNLPPGQITDDGPTLPIRATTPASDTAIPPTIPIKPQSRVEGVAEIVRKYDQGLHPDPKTGEWVPHKRNKGLQIIEGLGNFAASGIGLNLQGLLHPRGTPEQQARRALKDEIGIEDQSLQRQRSETDLEGDRATIALRSVQARKIQDLLDHPDTSDEDKRKLEVAKAILQSHPQGFDPSDPQDAVAMKKLEDAGIPIPASYGKKEKDAAGFNLSPGEARYDGKGNLIVERAPKAEDDVPDTTGPIGEQETRFRKNAATAQAAAEKAETDVKAYIQQQKTADPNYDSGKDANVASMRAEARRQREFAQDQTKRADDLTVKKIEAGNKTTTQRGKGQKGKLAPATHSFSIGAYIQRNEGATPDDARAFAAKNYPGFEVVN